MIKYISFFGLGIIILVVGWFVVDHRDMSLPQDVITPISEHISEHDTNLGSFNLPEKENRGEPLSEIRTQSIFVPYWADLSQQPSSSYDRYIYFGLSIDQKGIKRDDTGYQQMQNFLSFVPDDAKKLLCIRMIDRDLNAEILEDSHSWDAIVTDVLTIAQENQFDRVVLDLEVGLMAFGSYTENITPFTQAFYKQLSQHNIPLAFAIYGDTFFRKRPYTIEELNPFVDEFMIMAYDFSKSFGNPGPNFPYTDTEQEYHYSFQQMIQDYLNFVEPEKISVIFGMYGYHWVVDKQDRALKQADAITLHEVQSKYGETCSEAQYGMKRDSASMESVVTFYDEEGYKHIIWYEDEESSAAKMDYLKQQGIGDVVFWAWGYF